MPDKVPYASPAVRVFARELGVDLMRVTGSERSGRITKEDVQKFVKGALAGGAACAGCARRPPVAASTCCRGRKWISPNSAKWRASRFRASRRFPARTSPETGQ